MKLRDERDLPTRVGLDVIDLIPNDELFQVQSQVNRVYIKASCGETHSFIFGSGSIFFHF